MITKAIYTFCSNGKSIKDNSFHWLNPKSHLIGWVHSVFSVRPLFKTLALYTDSVGKNILIDILNLPFDEVHIIFDDEPRLDNSLFAIPKMITYSIQTEPFIHIDADIFINGPNVLTEELLSSDILTQSIEDINRYYAFYDNAVSQFLDSEILETPDWFKNRKEVTHAYCYGLFGGNNVSKITECFSEILKVIKPGTFDAIPDGNLKDSLNICYEQYMATVFLEKDNSKIKTLMSTVNLMDQEDEATEIGFCHLFGSGKKSVDTCNTLERCVMASKPDHHKKIEEFISS